MILIAIEKDKIKEIKDLDSKRTLLREIALINTQQPIAYNDDYYMLPWFYLFDLEEIVDMFLTYTQTFELLDENLDHPTVSSYQDIYRQQCLIFLHPALGKVPEQPLTSLVNSKILNSDQKLNQCNTVFKYILKKNGNPNIITEVEFEFNLKKVLNNKLFLKFEEDTSFSNEAEFFITYPCIQFAFQHIAMKARAIATGNVSRTKNLVEALINDPKDELYNEQVKILNKWVKKYKPLLSALSKEESDKYLEEATKSFAKIPVDLRTKEFVEEHLNKYINTRKEKKFQSSMLNNEYFQYFKNLETHAFNKLKNIKSLSMLLDLFLSDFESIKKGGLDKSLFGIFPKVALGAMLINDTRKITTYLEEYKTNVSESIVYDGDSWKAIIRESNKVGMLGKAPSNDMSYDFYSKEMSVVAKRNKNYYETGMTLGNGISGHMASILNIHDAEKAGEKMAIACSMLIFWEKFYDRRATNAHSYIEVFESIMPSDNTSAFQIKCTDPIFSSFNSSVSPRMFSFLVSSYINKTFSPITFLSLNDKSFNQDDNTNNLLMLKGVNKHYNIKYSANDIYILIDKLAKGETIYL